MWQLTSTFAIRECILARAYNYLKKEKLTSPAGQGLQEIPADAIEQQSS